MPGCGYCGNSPAKRDTDRQTDRQAQTPDQKQQQPTTKEKKRATKNTAKTGTDGQRNDGPGPSGPSRPVPAGSRRLTITCPQLRGSRAPFPIPTTLPTYLPTYLPYSSPRAPFAQRPLEPWFVQIHAIRLKSPNGRRHLSPFVPWPRCYSTPTCFCFSPLTTTPHMSALQEPETNVFFLSVSSRAPPDRLLHPRNQAADTRNSVDSKLHPVSATKSTTRHWQSPLLIFEISLVVMFALLCKNKIDCCYMSQSSHVLDISSSSLPSRDNHLNTLPTLQCVLLPTWRSCA
ncbi:hypothetical protein IWX47DRAFT_95715 [Phyllosticta citricarpa]